MAAVEAQASTENTLDEAKPTALFKKRGVKSKQFIRKRAATPPEATPSESEYSSEDDSGQKVKRRRKEGLVTAASVTITQRQDIESDAKFVANASTTIDTIDDATKHSDWFEKKDDINLSAKNLLGSTRTQATAAPNAPDGTYKGSASYKSFIQKNPNAPDRKFGPVKAAATNVRTITVTDFAPDVCKDYKQTGFCGFGDSCKFLHAREDYKQGWQLDRDWEIGKNGKKIGSQNTSRRGDKGNEEDNEETMLEKIPFACIICKQSYKNPTVTKCGHYFCENCAIQRYRKDPTCAACGAGTGGVFNGAKNLRKLLDKKKEREEAREKLNSEADINSP